MMRKMLLGLVLLMVGAVSLGLIASAQVAKTLPLDLPHQPGAALQATSQPGWVQSNADGFGEPGNTIVASLAQFETELYAGTHNGGAGAEIWRLDSDGWEPAMTGGFGDTDNSGIDHLAVFAGALYAGSTNLAGGGEIWRSDDGSDWSRVVAAGFGDPTNGEVFRFVVFGNALYATTWSFTETQGTEIWRSDTGDSGDWTQVVSNGFGDSSNGGVASFEIFGNDLYAGTYNPITGGEIWRSSDGTGWSQVNSDGFGDPENIAISSLAEFDGYLYAGVAGNDSTGAQIWRSPDGAAWMQVESGGFGNAGKGWRNALQVHNGQIYFVVSNHVDGLSVWRSSTGNGGDWVQIATAGFGDSNNSHPYWDNSTTVFDNSLFLGTVNFVTGGEVWRYPHYVVYVPAVMKNYRSVPSQAQVAMGSGGPEVPVTADEHREPATTTQEDLLYQVLAAGELVVATDANYPPWSFINDEGELDGFDVDVAEQVATRLGVQVEFVTPEWDVITAGNWGALWDVSIGSMTPSDERAVVLWFTVPYHYTKGVFAIHTDSTNVQDVSDLAGKGVGVGTGTRYEDYLLGRLDLGDYGGVISYPPPQVVVQPYTTDAEAIEDLSLGDGVRLDAVMSAELTIHSAIDSGLPLKYLPESAFSDPAVFALDQARGPSDLMIAELNGIVGDMQDDNTLSDLSMMWLGIDVTEPGEPWYGIFLPLVAR